MKKKFIGCFSIAVAVLVIGCFVYQFHPTFLSDKQIDLALYQIQGCIIIARKSRRQ